MKKRSYTFSVALFTILIQIVSIALPGYLFASCGICVEEKREELQREAPQQVEKKSHDCCGSKSSEGHRVDAPKKEHPSQPMPLSCTCCIKKVEPTEASQKITLENNLLPASVILPALNHIQPRIAAKNPLERPVETSSTLPIYIEFLRLLI